MAKITWGDPGERFFEVGVDRGVLYPLSGPGVPWTGLISVNETPSGSDEKPFYMDGIKYQNRIGTEEFSGTIEAYTYPEEFASCDGTAALSDGLFATQQYRQPFSFSYRTKIGNDTDGIDYGYKLHIVYNARATPSDRNNVSIRDQPEAITFSWGFSTLPVEIAGIKPTAHLVVDSTKTDPFVLQAVEDLLYGSSDSDPSLPLPSDLLEIYMAGGPVAPFVVTGPDGNGVFTVSGPDFKVLQLDPDHIQLVNDTVTDNGNGTYAASSE